MSYTSSGRLTPLDPAETSYLGDTATASANPGSGYFRWNNASATLVSEIYISTVDKFGLGVGNLFFEGTNAGSQIIFTKIGDPDARVRFWVNSVTDNAGWATIALDNTKDFIAPGFTSLEADAAYTILIQPSVNKQLVLEEQATSPTTSAGQGVIWSKNDVPNTLYWTNDISEEILISAGTKAAASFKFDSSTSAADPGSGDLRFNNASADSASNLYVSNSDRHGHGVNALLVQQIAPRSQILVIREHQPFRRARFWVSDWPTDNGTWVTIPVDNTKDSQSTGWANPSNGEPISVVIIPPSPGGNANKVQVALNESISTDATEIVVGGFYLDYKRENQVYSWEMLAKYTDGGGTGNQDIELRLYDMGADGSPTAGTLRSTLSVTSTSIDRVTQSLTVAASPGTGTNEIQDASRMYEIRAYLDAGGAVDSAIIYSAHLLEY